MFKPEVRINLSLTQFSHKNWALFPSNITVRLGASQMLFFSGL